ncbi:MAG: UDP-N-acetylmuramoyl-tripeptide--D-alanyl-D-alanine ligase [Roseburia sp.]
MKDMTLDRIANVCGGTYIGAEDKKNQEICGAVIDSRQVEAGYLFIPIRGNRVDGHKFIPEVFAKGALAVLSEQELTNPAGPYILVDSCPVAMQKIAAAYRRALDIKVVGITGSVGKTSTKEMIASVLEQKYRVLKTEGNFNNEVGLPLTIFKIRQEHEVAVLEMGISDFGEMHRLAEMAQPDIMVITNIGLCHLEKLITRDGILKAKTESFAHLTEHGLAVLNGDDDKLATQTTVNGRPPVFYGIGRISNGTGERTSKGNIRDIYAEAVEANGLDSTKAVIHVGEESFEAVIPIAGEHNVYNALAAAAVARELGLTTEQMKRGMETVATIGGRSNLLEKNGMTIIDDCYNANPVSMRASIDVLSRASGRKIAVLGDMGELGAKEKQLHYMVGAYFEGKKIDALFASGELATEIVRAVREHSPATEVFHFGDKGELTAALMNYVKPGDTVLVKASHFMGFPDIVRGLTE